MRVVARVDAGLVEPRAQLGLVARPDALAPRAPRRTDALPRSARDRCRGRGRSRWVEPTASGGALRTSASVRVHRVAVVGVRLVPLDLRELGRVLVRDALVAEVLRELVHLLEPADDQPLEVELVRDPEVEVGVELVRVRDERLGEPAAVTRLENRRLDLDEALSVEVGADRRDDPVRVDRESRATPRSSAGRGSAGGSGSRRR